MLKPAVNQATLMKTPMDVFLNSIGKAGFQGVELRRDETFAFLKDHSVADLKKILDANKLKTVTFNAIELFSLCSEDAFKGMLDYTEKLMKIGNQIGCDTIIAVPSFTDHDCVFPKEKFDSMTVSRLQILRKLAKKYNFRMGFEPLGPPTCSVRKVDHAHKILKAAEEDGLPPSGLMIDTFHFFVGEQKPEDLKKIPLDKLWLIHFNDCIKKPIAQLQDSDRVWPGEGFFDLKGFMTAAKSMKYDGFVSLEIFNPAYWKEDAQKMADQAMKSLKPFLK